MDVREKLVEFQNIITCPNAICNFCEYFKNNNACEKHKKEVIADNMIAHGVTVQEWISVEDRLPENSKKEGAFCPRYLVMTKYGESFGWYNPNFKSWFVLFWFFTDRLLAQEIDFERADVPKIVKVPDGVVTHWMPLPEPPEGE